MAELSPQKIGVGQWNIFEVRCCLWGNISELCEARSYSFLCKRESDMGVESNSGGNTVILLNIAGDVFNTEDLVGKWDFVVSRSKSFVPITHDSCYWTIEVRCHCVKM